MLLTNTTPPDEVERLGSAQAWHTANLMREGGITPVQQMRFLSALTDATIRIIEDMLKAHDDYLKIDPALRERFERGLAGA